MCHLQHTKHRYAAVPALLVFVSVVVVRTVLCGTAGLHFPPHFVQPRSTAYGPIHLTAEPTPSGQEDGKVICFTIPLYSHIFQSNETAFEEKTYHRVYFQLNLQLPNFSFYFICIYGMLPGFIPSPPNEPALEMD